MCSEVELGVLAAGAIGDPRGSMPIGGTVRAIRGVGIVCSSGTGTSQDVKALLTVTGPSSAFDRDEYVEICEGLGMGKSPGEESVSVDEG